MLLLLLLLLLLLFFLRCRYFLDNVAGWILELDRGEGYPFKGNYSGYLEKKMARIEAEAKVDNKRKKSLERELEASGGCCLRCRS